jgi:glycine cleavage system H protein
MNFPENLKYTKEHEWVKVEGNVATVGVTDFAQSELGDIVFVEIETKGETLGAGDTFGTVEAVKTVSDLYMPVSGEITDVNPEIQNNPQYVNEDPYVKGWMIKIKLQNLSELDELLAAGAYQKLTGH